MPGENEPMLAIDGLAGLLELVQAGVLEIHPWGSTVDRPERPDRMTIDLDPGEGVPWEHVIEAAFDVRARVAELGLQGSVKTTGGKGLHIVVPLAAEDDWEAVHAFAQALARRMAAEQPERYTATMAKAARRGRIYVDYLRNRMGATAVAAYSTRAGPGATVSVPLAWDELGPAIRSNHFTVENLPKRVAVLDLDPWDGFFSLLLRDDSLKAQSAGVPEDRVAVAPEVLAEADAAVVAIRSQELTERRFPLGQRRISEVEAVHEEQIERVQCEVARAAPQSFDQRPEAPRASLGQCDDFAINQPGHQREEGGSLGDRFKPLGPVEALPGAHGYAGVGDVELHPVAVIFDLVQPVRAGWRLVYGRREAGCDKGRELAGFCFGQVGRIENRLPPLEACRFGRNLALLGGPDAVLIAGISSIVRPVVTERGISARISGASAVRAAASSDLNRSHAGCFSRGLGAMRTRCQRPASFSPASSNLRWPLR